MLEDDAEDVLEEAAKTPRVMDEDREDAAKNVREEGVVLREEKETTETTEASEADEPRSSDATSSEDASAALLDASAAARARLETMLRGAEAYAAPER